ncbi:MAG: transglutaminase-like domain-containing protein [Jatrophihabitans sp.]|uniref:transglutaminase-like domain-containing protein n=1 Tax=Jatrophihabitans sp. TaxID=1932789 RepID=UPI003F7FF165
MEIPTRRVSAELLVQVDEPARITLQIAASVGASTQVAERLVVRIGGRPLPVEEVTIDDAARIHICRVPAGRLEVEYEATVDGSEGSRVASAADGLVFRRPSRFVESDRLGPVAQVEFAGITDAEQLLSAVSSWVGARLAYVPGSSGALDGAVDTLLLRRGVCRDFAHLVIALLRALDVPARLAAVYAPGLHPMDFHAVAEAAVDGQWRVVDASLLAPRRSLVRIVSGRDAADTAFLSSYGGRTTLLEYAVTATVDGNLPADDVRELVTMP